jgi:hypothetical protein
MTLDQAKNLKRGQTVHYTGRVSCSRITGPRGGVKTHVVRARVNGQVKTWKRDASRVYVPVMHGLRDGGFIDETNLSDWHLESDCPAGL